DRAGHQPQACRRQAAVVVVHATMDPDVFHRARPRAAMLHRAVLPARLRRLHARRRHPAEPAGHLERREIPHVPRRPAQRCAAPGLRQLRPALEPVSVAESARVALIIPVIDEGATIAGVVRAVPREVIDEIIVVDGGSRDDTVAAARAAGARVIVEPRAGYGAACLIGIRAAADCAGIAFIEGDGSDDPADLRALIAPILAGEQDFVIGSRARGAREAGSMGAHQLLAGRAAGLAMRALYGVRYTDMGPLRAIRRDALEKLAM